MISAVLLKRKKDLGYVLTLLLFVFIILMTLAIGGMVVIMNLKGFEADLSLTIIFSLIAIISSLILIGFPRHCKR